MGSPDWEDLALDESGEWDAAIACASGPDVLIVACGSVAAAAVLGRPVKITQEIGHVFTLTNGAEVILQFSPAYVNKLAAKKGGLSEKTKRLWFDVWDQAQDSIKGEKVARPTVYPLNRQQAIELLQWFNESYEGEWAYDYETWGDVDALRPDLCQDVKIVSTGIALFDEHKQIQAFSWLVDRDPDQFTDELVALWTQTIQKPNGTAHFSRYERKINIKRLGVIAPIKDTMLMARALDELADGSLERVMMRCGLFWASYKSEFDAIRKAPMDAPVDKLLEYNALDACGTLESAAIMEPQLEQEGLTHIARMDESISGALARQEMTGMYADQSAAHDVRKIIGKEKEEALQILRAEPTVQRTEVWALSNIKKYKAKKYQSGEVPVVFNPGSTPMLHQLCLKELKIQVTPDKKSGRIKLDKKAVGVLVHAYPVLKKVNELRSAESMVVFLNKWDDFIGSAGCIHTQYNQHIVVTGRLSSTDPPLQNIPKKSQIRRLFSSRFKGGWVVSADYAQQEPRLIAGWSADPTMMRVILEGMNLHAFVGAEIFGKTYDEVLADKDGKEYDVGKKMNLGIAYGQTEYGLSQKTGMSLEAAQALLKKYDRLFPGVALWRLMFHKQAMEFGYVTDLFGSRRHLPDAQSSDPWVRARALRQAGNYPVQGTAYRFTQIANFYGLELFDERLEGRALLTGQVHDSITAECDNKSKFDTIDSLREAMLVHNTQPYWEPFGMPMAVDIKIGRNLYEMEEVK